MRRAAPPSKLWRFAWDVRLVAIGLLSLHCSRPAVDASPEGALLALIDQLEHASTDGSALRDAYELLGPQAQANLTQRAARASRSLGRRYEPHEMLADGLFTVHFTPKILTARAGAAQPDEAWVEATGHVPSAHATVRCVRVSGRWRVEPELAPVIAPAQRSDATP